MALPAFGLSMPSLQEKTCQFMFEIFLARWPVNQFKFLAVMVAMTFKTLFGILSGHYEVVASFCLNVFFDLNMAFETLFCGWPAT